MSTGPNPIECDFEITVSANDDLMLRCWEIRLSKRPDARQGELPTYSVPDGVESGYLAIVWDGSILINDKEYGAGDCESRVVNLSTGMEIQLAESSDRARLAILGVDDDVLKMGPLTRGAHPFLLVDGTNSRVTFILRILEFAEFDERVTLEPWSRPGFLLSTVDGPGFGKRRVHDPNEIPELDFVLLAPNTGYDIGPGTIDQSLTMILDYFVSGDAALPRDPNGDLVGCKIRCWGGGIEE